MGESMLSTLFAGVNTFASQTQHSIKPYNKINSDLKHYNFQYHKSKIQNNQTQERWRNNNAEEKLVIKDQNGNLISTIIITNNGSKVINIAYINGKANATSWTLPSNVAAENDTLLLGSSTGDLLSSTSDTEEYKNLSTLDESTFKADNVEVKEIKSDIINEVGKG